MTATHLSFAKSDHTGLAYQDTLSSPLYETHHYARHIGWIGRNKDGQWIGWNKHGDFWTSYATSRDKAAEALAVAPWLYFVRAAA
jgi:hypothetical protein